MSSSFSRREFLQVLAGAAGVALVGAGCGGDGSTPTDDKAAQMATQNSDGTFTVTGGGKLQPGTGMGFLLPGAPGQPAPAMVFVTQKGDLRALSARCTHAGCAVKWDPASNNTAFLCPCHGSRFDTNGKVLHGPAKAPLTSYQARKSGNDAIIVVKA